MQLVGKRRALFQLGDGQVAGRREECRRCAQRVLEEEADVLDRFLLRLLFRFGNVGDHLDRKLLGPDVVAMFG